MRARTLILMAVLIFGGIGADWWMDEAIGTPSEGSEVTKKDGPDPPPSPQP